MTCIVSLAHKGKVYMGGDSAGIAGLDICSRSDEKVFVNGPLIMGFTSSFRMGQLLRYALNVPEQNPRDEDMRYLVVDVVDAMRACFKEKGYTPQEEDEKGIDIGGTFLMGYNGVLYRVDQDFQVGNPTPQYDACGCGEGYALGVLHYLMNNAPKMKPEDKLRYALDAACEHSAGVRGPYTILSI